MEKFKTTLILAPHTDDGELGCGATIARLIEEGQEIYYVAFSTCRKSVPRGYAKGILKKELKNASGILGIHHSNLKIYNYEVRELADYRQEILEILVGLRKDINPDLVFVPTLEDLHQDHYTIAKESLRAFKKGTVLGYEQPWNNLSFNPTSFFKVKERHVDKKIKALKCYKSQNTRSYMDEGFIKSLAKVRGVQIDAKYAEAFCVLRWVSR